MCEESRMTLADVSGYAALAIGAFQVLANGASLVRGVGHPGLLVFSLMGVALLMTLWFSR